MLLSFEKDDPVRKQLRDFQRLKAVLFSKEGNPELFLPYDSLAIELHDLQDQLNDEHSLLDQYRIFSRFISDLGCGHTQLHPNKKVYREWLGAYSSIPIDYFLFERRLITNELDPKEKSNLINIQPELEGSPLLEDGTEIVAIEGRSISEMMSKIGEYLSSDEDHIAFKYFQARQFFEFYRQLSYQETKDSITISYLSGDDTLKVRLATGKAPVNTMNERIYSDHSKRGSYESDMGKFKIIRGEYGYFRFKSFVSSTGKSYDDFLRSSFKQLKNEEIDKLVIDLRGNTGGVMQYNLVSYFTGQNVKLGSYIVSKPQNTSSDKGIKKLNSMYLRHMALSKKQEQEIRSGNFDSGDVYSPKVDTNLIYKGQLIVITDEGTFSSAAMLACHLKTLAKAKIIGRTAGGSFYGGNSGTLLVTLPNSKFTLLVNPNSFKSQLERGDDPIAIKIPDLELHPKYMIQQKLDAYYFREATRTFE